MLFPWPAAGAVREHGDVGLLTQDMGVEGATGGDAVHENGVQGAPLGQALHVRRIRFLVEGHPQFRMALMQLPQRLRQLEAPRPM